MKKKTPHLSESMTSLSLFGNLICIYGNEIVNKNLLHQCLENLLPTFLVGGLKKWSMGL